MYLHVCDGRLRLSAINLQCVSFTALRVAIFSNEGRHLNTTLAGPRVPPIRASQFRFVATKLSMYATLLVGGIGREFKLQLPAPVVD